MKTRDEIKKYYLCGILLMLMFIPMTQGVLHLFEETKLNGAVESRVNPVFNLNSWFNGTFQKSKEEYLNEQFGFRSFFIRLYNQVEYSLFGNAHAKYIVKGKENYFFEYNYLKTYYGLDFIGESKIDSTITLMRALQDSLEQYGKTFVFVMTASKGQYCAEYFPDSCVHLKSRTNYEVYATKAIKQGIHFIDFNPYFLNLKKTTEYPLYSKYGIHWTNYGACIAADSLIHYIESIRNIRMPHLFWNEVKVEDAHPDDRDIELGMNLLFPFEKQTLAYPVLKYNSDSTMQRPSVMVIGDSYYWSLYNIQIFSAFKKNQFWYYYYQIYENGMNGPVEANDELLKKALHDFDIVILLGTDINLYNFGWDFLEHAEKMLKTDQQN